MLLVILDAKKLSEHFMKKNCKKMSQKEFKTENVKKRKGHKLYVRHKGYENSFNKKDQ